MTAGDYLTVAAVVRRELADLQAVADRAAGAWTDAASSSSGYNVDAAALNLHGFYVGLERIFVTVAERIDGSVPTGPAWHQELLRQMSVELPN